MNEKIINVINNLIKINNDRIAGYKAAYKETEEEVLKDMFNEIIITIQQCNADLATEVFLLGGQLETTPKASGKVFQMDEYASRANELSHN